MNLYARLLRPLLFRFDAETAHHLALFGLRNLPRVAWTTLFGAPPRKPVHVFGLEFPNPVGLAAGMDKNADALLAWEALGFGFLEAGTITAHAQPGNEKPRCFRYPRHHALINRMGFNNDGAEAIARRLEAQRAAGRWPRIPVGMNIGKSKITPLEEAAADYATSFRHLRPFADYFVVNVSSPNTPGLRQLQDSAALQSIIRTLRDVDAQIPLLVKIAPDLEPEAIDDLARLAEEEKLSGLIATNTTLDHSILPLEQDQAGGLSGAPLLSRSNDVLRRLRSTTRLPIIASGGVMNAAAAAGKFEAGADLVQIYTGFVYRGPDLIRDIVNVRP